MSIIAFWSDNTSETAQTLSMVALTTYMAIEHNYKILSVTTNFNDATLEECYWDFRRAGVAIPEVMGKKMVTGLGEGIEGLMKLVRSNKNSPNIIHDYTRVIFKEKFDVLPAPKTSNYDEYSAITPYYPEVLQLANQSYDFVFVDVSKRMPRKDKEAILQIADVVVVNITQRLKLIDNWLKLKTEDPFFKDPKMMTLIGRYDKYSKMNKKNVTRYLKEKKVVSAVAYNTLFFEACAEGEVVDFFMKMKRIDPTDRNAVFVKEIKAFTDNVIYKAQEMQMRR